MSKLSNLFRWSKKVDIKDGNKVLASVYIRLVGDDDYVEARGISLRYSKELRIKLRDTTSVEYNESFADLVNLGKEELIMGIVVGELSNYRDEAVTVIREKEAPELPDNPTLEQQEAHETKLTELREERVQEIAGFIDKKSEDRKTELAAIEDLEKLRTMYSQSIINIKCMEEFSRVFREFQVYKGTYNDSEFKELAFDSFEDFTSSSPQLKTQLLNAYLGLEIGGEDLKN